jgi:ABC-type branched-subunit amino acid transport system permease subunit
MSRIGHRTRAALLARWLVTSRFGKVLVPVRDAEFKDLLGFPVQARRPLAL